MAAVLLVRAVLLAGSNRSGILEVILLLVHFSYLFRRRKRCVLLRGWYFSFVDEKKRVLLSGCYFSFVGCLLI